MRLYTQLWRCAVIQSNLETVRKKSEFKPPVYFQHLSRAAVVENERRGHERSSRPTNECMAGDKVWVARSFFWGPKGPKGATQFLLGTIRQQHTPLCNVWLTLLNGIGVEAERHGVSTGVVKELQARAFDWKPTTIIKNSQPRRDTHCLSTPGCSCKFNAPAPASSQLGGYNGQLCSL